MMIWYFTRLSRRGGSFELGVDGALIVGDGEDGAGGVAGVCQSEGGCRTFVPVLDLCA